MYLHAQLKSYLLILQNIRHLGVFLVLIGMVAEQFGSRVVYGCRLIPLHQSCFGMRVARTLRSFLGSIYRNSLIPATGFREPRTWAVTSNGDSDVDWNGRNRGDWSGFDDVELNHSQTEAGWRIKSSKVLAEVHNNPFRIDWYKVNSDESLGPQIMSDRVTSAYLIENRTGATRHYLQRNDADKFFGLGDKTGPNPKNLSASFRCK